MKKILGDAALVLVSSSNEEGGSSKFFFKYLWLFLVARAELEQKGCQHFGGGHHCWQ